MSDPKVVPLFIKFSLSFIFNSFLLWAFLTYKYQKTHHIHSNITLRETIHILSILRVVNSWQINTLNLERFQDLSQTKCFGLTMMLNLEQNQDHYGNHF